MFKLIFVIALAYIVASGLGLVSKAHGAELSDSYAECVKFSIHGYENEEKQTACKAEFPSLPSPLRFRCVVALERGFPTEDHIKLCILYFGTADPTRWAKEA